MRQYLSLTAISLTVFQFHVAFADSPPVPAGGAPAGDAGAPPQPSLLMGMLPFVLMFGIIWFLVLRPQQKKLQEQQQMLTELKHGDQVVTSSGMLGTVRGITDKVVTLEIADDVKIKMLKTQVNQVIKDGMKDLA